MQFCGTRKVETAVPVDSKVGSHRTVVRECGKAEMGETLNRIRDQ